MRELRLYRGDCPADLYSFRYRIYVDEMGRTQRYADHDAKIIKDPLDDFAVQGVAFDNGAMVGCLRANFLRDGDIGEYKSLYRIDDLSPAEIAGASICTRFMVEPTLRGTALPMRLLLQQYADALEQRITTCYVDCNEPMRDFFIRFGFKSLFLTQHPEYGRVEVMRLDIEDAEHLVSVRSPFLSLYRKAMAQRAMALAAE